MSTVITPSGKWGNRAPPSSGRIRLVWLPLLFGLSWVSTSCTPQQEERSELLAGQVISVLESLPSRLDDPNDEYHVVIQSGGVDTRTANSCSISWRYERVCTDLDSPGGGTASIIAAVRVEIAVNGAEASVVLAGLDNYPMNERVLECLKKHIVEKCDGPIDIRIKGSVPVVPPEETIPEDSEE